MQGLIASPCTPAPGSTGRRGRSRGSQVGVAQKMWQNVSKIFPLFCGKIFEIFCHGLPAGGGQLFRTSTIFLPLLTPTFRRTPVNDNKHCVKFCCLHKSDCSRFCTGYQLDFALTSLVLPADIPACVPWRLVVHRRFVTETSRKTEKNRKNELKKTGLVLLLNAQKEF